MNKTTMVIMSVLLILLIGYVITDYMGEKAEQKQLEQKTLADNMNEEYYKLGASQLVMSMFEVINKTGYVEIINGNQTLILVPYVPTTEQ